MAANIELGQRQTFQLKNARVAAVQIGSEAFFLSQQDFNIVVSCTTAEVNLLDKSLEILVFAVTWTQDSI
jgi:hypothetical protein